MLETFADGVWLVELGDVTDAALVPQTVPPRWACASEPGRDSHRPWWRHMRDRALLLVLDNCEHLLDACADLADTPAAPRPSVRILATSREPLGVAGERVLPVPIA